MKIVNLCLCGIYSDGWTYQDNLLPKYHKANGFETTIIASDFMAGENNRIVKDKRKEYINENGVLVIRLDSGKYKYSDSFKRFSGLYEALEQQAPDILFIHGVQFVDIKVVVKYLKKHKNVKVYVDNHADFLNSASNWLSKNILHKVIWRYLANKIEPFVTKFYGVLPARVEFLKNVYKLPDEKLELLVMGADDEKIQELDKSDFRETFRSEYNINDDDFLLITGGKIDRNKPETLELMKAVVGLKNIKLIVFGSVVPSLENEFKKLLENDNIIYLGWLQSTDFYKYIIASDLAVFPGKHSVLWEQVVGLGIPCIFRKLDGFTHIDIGGNCILLDNVSEYELRQCILNIYNDKDLYNNMKKISKEKGMTEFSYNEIARRSVM